MDDRTNRTVVCAAGRSVHRTAALSVSVAISAFTLKRWDMLVKAVESVRSQTVLVDEVVVCVDNNPELLCRAQETWSAVEGVSVKVIANRHSDHLERVTAHRAAHGTNRRFGAGSARNTATEAVRSDIVAFMDDDAWAHPDWLEKLLRVYDNPRIVAVGGPPKPRYETARPSWYPANFDWVFGCAYDGLPTQTGPTRHLIGANMSVRRAAWEAIGGFVGSDFDDLNLCLRLAERFGVDSLYYVPDAVVDHFVPAERVTWRYFWRRCYFVNREKVRVFRRIGAAANLHAERDFVLRAVTRQTMRDVRRAASGEVSALRSLAAMFAGIALASLGHLRGRLDAQGFRSGD